MKQSIFSLFGGILLFGCSSLAMDKMEVLDYSVIRYEDADFSAIHKFNPVIGEFEKFLFFLDQKQTFRITAISYPTVDPNGNPIEASGLIFHPTNRKSRGVIDFLPTAHLEKDGGGTDEMYAVEGLLILLGYTVIVPDLIGSGISKESKIPFLMFENTGRVAYDMRRAAAQYLWDEFHYQLPLETIIMGLSLGGSAGLATLHYYETHHPNTVKVKESYLSGGAYDLPSAFEAFAKSGFSEYPAIPFSVLAFDHYYNLHLDFANVFRGELLANYPDWFSGDVKAYDIMDFLGTNLHAYLHEDFFKPLNEQNEDLQRLYPYLVKNSVPEGWRPKSPILMAHAQVDTYVPTENAQVAVKRMRRAGANIDFFLYPGDHLSVCDHFFLRAILRYL